MNMPGSGFIRTIAALGLLACPAGANPPPHKSAPAKMKSSSLQIIPWFSLKPAPGAVEARLGMQAEIDPKSTKSHEVELITVFGTRRAPIERAPVVDPPGGESWQSDAAQPMLPGLGDGCTSRSVCVDPNQQGLFSTLPKLFGGN